MRFPRTVMAVGDPKSTPGVVTLMAAAAPPWVMSMCSMATLPVRVVLYLMRPPAGRATVGEFKGHAQAGGAGRIVDDKSRPAAKNGIGCSGTRLTNRSSISSDSSMMPSLTISTMSRSSTPLRQFCSVLWQGGKPGHNRTFGFGRLRGCQQKGARDTEREQTWRRHRQLRSGRVPEQTMFRAQSRHAPVAEFSADRVDRRDSACHQHPDGHRRGVRRRRDAGPRQDARRGRDHDLADAGCP